MGNEISNSALRMELTSDPSIRITRKSSRSFSANDKGAILYKNKERKYSFSVQRNPTLSLNKRCFESNLKEKHLKDHRNLSLDIILKKEPPKKTTSSPGLISPESSRKHGSRGRSQSLCGRPARSNSMYVASTSKPNGHYVTRKVSYLSVLQRIRIQHCFKAAKPQTGKSIIKKACQLRGEFRSFFTRLPEQVAEDLETDIYQFIAQSVENINDIEQVNLLSINFGEGFVPLYSMGFRPEYFAVIADAATAECIKLDGGTHRQYETTLAWIQHFSFLFSNVRDGYYALMRSLRRDSLPQYRLLNKQAFNNSNRRSRESF